MASRNWRHASLLLFCFLHQPPYVGVVYVAGVGHALHIVLGLLGFPELPHLDVHTWGILSPKPDHRALVPYLVAVVRGGEDRETSLVVRPLKAVVLALMGPDHQIQVVRLQEALGDVGPEGHNSVAPQRAAEAWCARVGVRPQKVGEEHTLLLVHLSRVLEPIQAGDLLKGDLLPGDPPVGDEDLRVHHVGQGQAHEKALKGPEDLHVHVLGQDLAGETVMAIHALLLVIAPREKEVPGQRQLKSDQHQQDLY
mmetsp:Transcript_38536/g.92094  ORF Transcript_38536/g.92094 Transcript_38536/m.92094 type:complete len:253 (+) Transcript_38536:80-838(+)